MDMYTAERPAADPVRRLDAVVVGAGFAGLYMLHRLRGLGMRVIACERGDGVGGTWYWNRYPGARCDIESMEYSYQFSPELQQEWNWSERYAAQPEILRYLEHVADRYALREDIAFNTTVTAANFDEAAGLWTVRSDDGRCWTARYLVLATGALSQANLPDFPGSKGYLGKVYHTGRWPRGGVDFHGKRVGVIGTGSSAIQAIPLIARQAAQLTVFQRTPTYSVPARNRPLSAAERDAVKARYAEFRRANAMTPIGAGFHYHLAPTSSATPEERQRRYEQRWNEYGGLDFLWAFGDLLFDRAANEAAAEFIRGKIRAIVHDPATAERLCPRNVVVGCKRLCSDTDYYQTYNRDNVALVDVSRDPIESLTPGGLRVAGEEYAFDAIVFATGFDALTGSILAIDLRGRGGRALRDKWAAGPRTYLGLQTAEFPNLFIVAGPGSPSVLSNMVPAIEQHVNFIADTLAHMRDRELGLIEADPQAEDDWVAHVNAVADATLFPQCNSWYLGANVPGKPRVFMPYLGFDTYVRKCEEVVAAGYAGFRLAALPAVAA